MPLVPKSSIFFTHSAFACWHIVASWTQGTPSQAIAMPDTSPPPPPCNLSERLAPVLHPVQSQGTYRSRRDQFESLGKKQKDNSRFDQLPLAAWTARGSLPLKRCSYLHGVWGPQQTCGGTRHCGLWMTVVPCCWILRSMNSQPMHMLRLCYLWLCHSNARGFEQPETSSVCHEYTSESLAALYCYFYWRSLEETSWWTVLCAVLTSLYAF